VKSPVLAAVAAVAAVATASPDKAPSPRVRAAYGMVLHLEAYAKQLVEIDAERHQFTKNGCPTGIEWVTFGTAKTDPWGHAFVLRCTAGDPSTIAIGSLGPDGKAGTADDLWSDRALIDPAAGCRAACAKARACAKNALDEKVRDELCGDGCATALGNAAFHVDSCARIDGCKEANSCLVTAGHRDGHSAGIASCKEFATVASRAVGKPKAAAALEKVCDQDVLRVHELPCVAASTNVTELTRCFLTVNRDEVEAILSR
jgi:hypothetical protein